MGESIFVCTDSFKNRYTQEARQKWEKQAAKAMKTNGKKKDDDDCGDDGEGERRDKLRHICGFRRQLDIEKNVQVNWDSDSCLWMLASFTSERRTYCSCMSESMCT